jgi:putative endonuclease
LFCKYKEESHIQQGGTPLRGGWFSSKILNLMFKVYILKSIKHGKYYVGHTHDLNDRLSRHNSGQNKSTKSGLPWQIIYTEELETKQEAYKREFEIKSYKGGIKFKKLLGLLKN